MSMGDEHRVSEDWQISNQVGAGTRSQQLNEELGLCRITTTHARYIESVEKVV
jgi:hypothetical protein